MSALRSCLNRAKPKDIWLLTYSGFLSHEPGARRSYGTTWSTLQNVRDFCCLQRIVHHVHCLRLTPSTSKLPYRSFFGLSVRTRSANQLVLVHGERQRQYLSTFPWKRKRSSLQRTSSVRWRPRVRYCYRCCRLSLEITSFWTSKLRLLLLPRLDDEGIDLRQVLYLIKTFQAKLEPRKRTRARHTLPTA